MALLILKVTVTFSADKYLSYSKELIKTRELEKDELRPLYMDFQATTPMVPMPFSSITIQTRESSS